MVFENEINIYDPNAIANEFHTQSTQISAVQGKISAMISDSQIQELMDGRINMFDRLVSAEMDINGITTQVSSLRQADGQLESEISTIRQTASSISAEVSSVKNNYAQKAQLILAINHVTQESEAVINASHISLAGKTIELTSDNITINSTYFKVDRTGKVTATSGTFSGSVTASSGNIGGFTIGASSIYNGMTSFSDTTHNGVYLGTNGIALGRGAFKVSSSGAMTATSGTFGGTLSAATGTFAGNLSAAGGTFRGSLQAATGTFSGNLSAAGGTFKGALQAATGTFAGTLSAACITSGTMSAARIHGGTLTLGGSGDGDGSMRVNNSSGDRIVLINNYGIRAYDNSGNQIGSWTSSGIELKGNSNGFLRMSPANGFSLYWSGSDASVYTKTFTRSASDDYLPVSTGIPDFRNEITVGNNTYTSCFRPGEIRLEKTTKNTSGFRQTAIFELGYFEIWNHVNNKYMSFSTEDGSLTVNGRIVASESSSSKRYKHNIESLLNETLDPHRLYNLKPKQYRYNADVPLQYDDMYGQLLPGFIAEDVAEIYPSAVIHHPEHPDVIESWDERRIIPPMLSLIQEQHEQIMQLVRKVESLERRTA